MQVTDYSMPQIDANSAKFNPIKEQLHELRTDHGRDF